MKRTDGSRRDYDVVVVGARCGGAATAMLLAERGLDVLLVDRAQYGSDTGSTHALMRGAVLQLHRWGLLDRVKAAGTPTIRRTVFTYGDEVLPVHLAPADGIDGLYAPKRTVLDPILVDGARDAGADVRFGVTVTDLRRDEAGRVAGILGRSTGRSTGRGSGGSGDGTPFEANARLTIGADGVRSLVARKVGARAYREGRNAGASIYGYWSGFESDAYQWFYRPGIGAGVIPTNDGDAMVFVSTDRDRFAAEARGDVRRSYVALLEEAAPEILDEMSRSRSRAPERVRSFPGVPGFLRQPWGSSWALVGDAGYFKDPITAHGITDALRDAELLADATASGLGGSMPLAVALAGYQRQRDLASDEVIRATEAVASYRWTLPEVKTHLLELSAAMKEEVSTLRARDGARVPQPA